MSQLRGFKVVFSVIGALYILMASSMLVRGVGALRQFGVPESLVTSLVVVDFFMFFYQLMAFVGVLMVLFGQLVRERSSQLLVSGVFFVWCLFATWRDLSTSDSPWGNATYKGEDTMVFPVIGITFALAFGGVALFGLLRPGARTRETALQP
jgi:hypothetical protein